MNTFKWILAALLALPVLLWLAGQMGWLAGRAPTGLGVHDGRLKPPSGTDNSVSSQALLWPDHARQTAAQIPPLALRGDGQATVNRLAALLASRPGCQVVTQQPDYLYAICRTRQLKFVDDLEFWFDPAAQVVQLRSASRVGRRDFGVNRARIEALRAQLAAG